MTVSWFIQLWDLQDLLNRQQLVQDDKLGEQDSDDSDDDGMDVDMDPNSSKGSIWF